MQHRMRLHAIFVEKKIFLYRFINFLDYLNAGQIEMVTQYFR